MVSSGTEHTVDQAEVSTWGLHEQPSYTIDTLASLVTTATALTLRLERRALTQVFDAWRFDGQIHRLWVARCQLVSLTSVWTVISSVLITDTRRSTYCSLTVLAAQHFNLVCFQSSLRDWPFADQCDGVSMSVTCRSWITAPAYDDLQLSSDDDNKTASYMYMYMLVKRRSPMVVTLTPSVTVTMIVSSEISDGKFPKMYSKFLIFPEISGNVLIIYVNQLFQVQHCKMVL